MEEVEIKKTEEMQEIKNEEMQEIKNEEMQEIKNEEMQEIKKEENLNNLEIIENSNKTQNTKTIILIIGLIVIIVVLVGYLLFVNFQGEGSKPMDNQILSTNNDDSVISSNLDDATKSDDEEDENQVVAYIYKSGYSGDAPIAFTYKCEGEECYVRNVGKYFLIYDSEKVKYREMTQYEYEQIYNEDNDVNGEKLDKTDFKELNPVYDSKTLKKVNHLENYEIEEENIRLDNFYYFQNEMYYIEYGEIYTIDEYNKSNEEDIDIVNVEQFLLVDCWLYDYKNNVLIDLSEELMGSEYKKEGEFHVFYVDSQTDGGPYCEIYDQNYKNYTAYMREGYYIKDDKLYFIEAKEKNDEYVNQFAVYNSNSKHMLFLEENEYKPLLISKENLYYLDKDNILNKYNIATNKTIKTYDIEINIEGKYYIYELSNEGIEIIYNDHSVMNNEDFETFRVNSGITDEEYNEVKKCMTKPDECEVYGFDMGYKITIEKDVITKKSYIFEIY